MTIVETSAGRFLTVIEEGFRETDKTYLKLTFVTWDRRRMTYSFVLPNQSKVLEHLNKFKFLIAAAAIDRDGFKFNFKNVPTNSFGIYYPRAFARIVEEHYPELTSDDPVDALLTTKALSSGDFPYLVGPLTILQLNLLKKYIKRENIEITPEMIRENRNKPIYMIITRDDKAKEWQEETRRLLRKYYPTASSFLSEEGTIILSNAIESLYWLSIYDFVLLLLDNKQYDLLRRIIEKHTGGRRRLGKVMGDKAELTVVLEDRRSWITDVVGRYTGLVYLEDLLVIASYNIGEADDHYEVYRRLDRYLDENVVTDRSVRWDHDELIVPDEETGDVIYCSEPDRSCFKEPNISRIRIHLRMNESRKVFRPLHFKRLPEEVFSSEEERRGLILTGCLECKKIKVYNPYVAVGKYDSDTSVVGILGEKDGKPVHYLTVKFGDPEAALVSAFLDVIRRNILKPKSLEGVEEAMSLARLVHRPVSILEKYYGPDVNVCSYMTWVGGKRVGALSAFYHGNVIADIYFSLDGRRLETLISNFESEGDYFVPVRAEVYQDLVDDGFELVEINRRAERPYVLYRKGNVVVALRAP